MGSNTEMLEVLDENGVGTGRPETRENIHRQGLWHRAILVAIINDDNKILIQKRSQNKEKFPGLWDLSVAGHVPFGYDSVSCAASEVMEKVGIMLPKRVEIRDFRFMTSFRSKLFISDKFIENQFYDFFLYNTNIPIEQLHIQKEEVEGVRYASAFVIKQMVERGLFHPRTEWVNVLYNYITKF